MTKPINANGFVFFPDLMISMIKALERGATVTRYTHSLKDLDIEFEVRISRLNGKTLPRATECVSAANVKGRP